MKFSLRILMLICVLTLSFVSRGQTIEPLTDLFSDEPEFLKVEEAFQFDFKQQDGKLILSWVIADGYYLYKKQFKTVVKNAEIGEPEYPVAEQIEDEYFGLSDIFRNQLNIVYPIQSTSKDGMVKIRFQGCADAGLCYQPIIKEVYLTHAEKKSEQFELAGLLDNEQGLFWTLLLFVGLGIGLAFTPCVFPMYPILSGIVIGQGKTISAKRAFSLSFVYVQGMAITYSLLGLVVASAGVQFQASLQHPAILYSLIVIFVLLAIVMFGVYELTLPSSWQTKLNNLSNKQTSGSYFGVLMMGAISGLVASPCTTAPLTGILLFIAQSGDLLLGFSALYALSLGMGIPLIVFGMTGGKLLPKAGNWMNIVKVTFGFMMLSVALIFVERLVSHYATDLAWALLGLAVFSYYYVMNQATELSLYKGVRAFFIFAGIIFSALYGYHSYIGQQPAVHSTSTEAESSTHGAFVQVANLQEFQQELAVANAAGKTVMVDLYADWCVACKEFEKYTFPAPQVVKALSNSVLIQIDLTESNEDNFAFQEQFSVLGLPTILFFDLQGQEMGLARVTGYMKAEPFAEHVNRIFK